jgi:hypothetical protein
MAQQPGKSKQGLKRHMTRPILLACFSLLLIIVLVGVGTWAVVWNSPGSKQAGNPSSTSMTVVTQANGTPITVSGPVSPLLFGTNLSLFDNNDQVLNSSTTLSLLQRMHPGIIRMPIRSSLSDAVELRAAQLIKSTGVAPLIVLHGPDDQNTLASDIQIVTNMTHIFGNSVVYYEYDNESDLRGISADQFVASWNAVIPQLKRIAPHGQFIGPVNFQYNHDYLVTFLKNANPRPDEVSWHEYTCDDSWPNATCLSHIDNWTRHISDARSSMVATIGKALPIMITEWNYAPNAVPNDGKNNNPAFLSAWTTKALQTLAANRVFASMQYACTNTAINLIADNNTLTPQGSAFQSLYQQIIVQGHQPAPVTSTGQGQSTPGTTPTLASTPSSPTHLTFSFEDGGTDGWSAHGSQISQLQNSSILALDGKHSLQVTLSNLSSGSYPYISIGGSQLSSYPRAGQTFTASIYLPSNSVTLVAKLFIMDNSYHWLTSNGVSLTPGTWTHLTYTIPTSASSPPRQLGIQFSTPITNPISTPVYVDAIGWS